MESHRNSSSSHGKYVSPRSRFNDLIPKSQSVKNRAPRDEPHNFFDKAFQMDELIKLRQKVSDYDQRIKEFKLQLIQKDNEINTLTIENQSLLQELGDERDETQRKDAIIEQLKQDLTNLQNAQTSEPQQEAHEAPKPQKQNSLAKNFTDDRYNLPLKRPKSTLQKEPPPPLPIKPKELRHKAPGHLQLEDLDLYVFKKNPDLERPELHIDFQDDFKQFLDL